MSKTPAGNQSTTRVQVKNYEKQNSTAEEINRNFASILKVNEEKQVTLDNKFFKKQDGKQDQINDNISKSVQTFVKQQVMSHLRLTGNHESKKVGAVFAD